MRSIPLDFERRLKQRWATRFSGVPQVHVQPRQLTAADKRKPANSPPAQGSPAGLALTGAGLVRSLVA